MRHQITYGRLQRMLQELRFESSPVKPKWKAFRHSATGTFIVLANQPPDTIARRHDVVSIRRHLVDNGILDEQRFDDFCNDAA